MSERIRYTSEFGDSNIALVSTRVFSIYIDGVANGYRVHLRPVDLTYEVRDAVTGSVVAKGVSPSFHRLKANAKKALSFLGYDFVKEKRVQKVKTEAVA